jgi:hypothetical protein
MRCGIAGDGSHGPAPSGERCLSCLMCRWYAGAAAWGGLLRCCFWPGVLLQGGAVLTAPRQVLHIAQHIPC